MSDPRPRPLEGRPALVAPRLPVPSSPPSPGTGRAFALGSAALVAGLLVPLLAFVGLPVASRTPLHLAVACLAPVLGGLFVWSATSVVGERRTSWPDGTQPPAVRRAR